MPKYPAYEPIYNIIAAFVESCIIRDGSLFGSYQEVWTLPTVENLYYRIQAYGKDSETNLAQLFRECVNPSMSDSVQLAAELTFLYQLADADMSRTDKAAAIDAILSLSPLTTAMPHRLLHALTNGIAPVSSTITNTKQAVLVLLGLVQTWKSYSLIDQMAASRDPIHFKRLTESLSIANTSASVERNLILHLFQPEFFELIVQDSHKTQIVNRWRSRLTTIEDDVDVNLLNIRRALSDSYASDYSYYDSDVLPEWNASSNDAAHEVPAPSPPYVESHDLLSGRDQYLAAVSRLVALGQRVPTRQRMGRTQLINALEALAEFVDSSALEEIKAWAALDPKAFHGAIRSALARPDGWERAETLLDAVSDSGHLSKTAAAVLASILASTSDPYRFPPFDPQTSAVGTTAMIAPGENASDRIKSLYARLDEVVEANGASEHGASCRLDAWLSSRHLARSATPSPGEDTRETVSATLSRLDELADRLLLPRETLSLITAMLSVRGMVILAGPPGTGKTYLARELAEFLSTGPTDDASTGTSEIVICRPGVSDATLIEDAVATSSGKLVITDGVLKRLAHAAADNPTATFVLVLDELCHIDISTALAETLYLLDRRGANVTLRHSGERFSVPANLLVLATLNTADKSIMNLDTALHRRCFVLPFVPNQPPVDGLLRRWLRKHNPGKQWVADLLDAANLELKNPEIMIGPSHFLIPNLDEELVRAIWKHSIVPYISSVISPEAAERLSLGSLVDEKLNAGPTSNGFDPNGRNRSGGAGIGSMVPESLFLDTAPGHAN